MGIKTVSKPYLVLCARISEKPPHHMGIKTRAWQGYFGSVYPLKNLPTTWGLRLYNSRGDKHHIASEKPPHHMGIKTYKTV